MNKNSYIELNGEQQKLFIPKEIFEAFINDKEFYAKFGKTIVYLFQMTYKKR